MNPEQNNFYKLELERISRKGLMRTLPQVSRVEGNSVLFNGMSLLNLSSNDYLGLGSDRSLLNEFFLEYGPDNLDGLAMTSSSSRLLSGNHSAYGRLEAELSDSYKGRASCVFGSGYHANVGICSALAPLGAGLAAGRKDLFLCDKLDHASIIDGARLSGADVLRYRHCDYSHLESLLEKHRSQYKNVFIVSESVFSMDGDIADVKRLIWLKKKHDAILILDEAHAVGVFGENGLGVCEVHDVINEVDIIVGTFGKALASFGAFAIMDEIIRRYLINTMRPLIFTTALPPSVVNWTLKTFNRMKDMRAERRFLAKLAEKLRGELADAGATTKGSSQIVPVIIGENEDASQLADRLQADGFLLFPIRPPTVPPGTARLRISLTASMKWEEIRRVPEIIGEFVFSRADSLCRKP